MEIGDFIMEIGDFKLVIQIHSPETFERNIEVVGNDLDSLNGITFISKCCCEMKWITLGSLRPFDVTP
jgi:hypothetical protein